MRLELAALLVPLAACAPTRTTEEPPPATVPSTQGLNLDRVLTGCNSFNVHITNAEQTAMVHLQVEVERLGLPAGETVLTLPRDGVTVTLDEFAEPARGEWWCTDVETGPRPVVATPWRASGGQLRVHLHRPPSDASHEPDDGPYDRLDLELVDVVFDGPDGRQQTVSGRYGDIAIGWLPG